MRYRQLGRSGLLVSELSFGTMTFGNVGYREPVIGSTDISGARRQVDMCLDAGVNLIDTADVYADGRSEEIVGEAVEGRRDRLLLATKVRFPTGDGVNDGGLSRRHLIRSCENSLRRLRTDHIDLYQVHGWDGQTPVEETLDALDTLVRDGKVRYVGCSNFSAWHVMKSLAASERLGLQRYVSQQINYTMLSREAEYELVPVALDQEVAILVWSPLAGGLLTGKYRRDADFPAGVRHASDWDEPPVEDWERLWDIVDALVEVSEQQRLDAVSAPPLLYPYWHQARSILDRVGAADLSLLGAHTPPGDQSG
jgi:aryl-alcohol dehydrogenase-like predicted oxidoreductase